MDLTDDQLLRYSRHVLLDEIGIEGQRALCASHVVIVGAGGLGCAAALYLAASGIGHLTLVDADIVDLTNLQRQIAHTTESVGQAKVVSLSAACKRLNPDVQIDAVFKQATPESLLSLLNNAHLVLDCTDNFATRQAINAASVDKRVPLVSGSAIRFDAQLSVFDPRRADSPCYACVFPNALSDNIDATCATMGVLSPLVGMVGSMQAAQALAVLTGFGTALVGKLLLIDARGFSLQTMTVARNPGCAVCGQRDLLQSPLAS